MSTHTASRRTDTAVLIHSGTSASARRLRDRLSVQGVHCADVRVDVGGVLPAPEGTAFAVVEGDELAQRRDSHVAGWLAPADAAGVTIFPSVDAALAAAA